VTQSPSCTERVPLTEACPDSPSSSCPLDWFEHMIAHCLAYCEQQRQAGTKIVGILCEYTPRELILAAGAVPVLLCGGTQKTIPAAERQLPANLCPLIKSTYGYHLEGTNPFLEMASLVVAETTCDGKKKMYELLSQGRALHVLALPHRENDPDALNQWENELRKLKAELERRFSVEITECRIRQAIVQMNCERSLRRELSRLMRSDPPPFSGKTLLGFRSSVSGNPEDLGQYQKALDLFARKGGDPSLSSRVRVLMTGVPIPYGAEWIVDLIEGAGGVVVCFENCTGLKPILEDVDESAADPIRALAEKYHHLPCSVMTENQARIGSLRGLVEEYRPDCVIELVWQACLTYDIESLRVRRLVEDELDLPYLKIETDYSRSATASMEVRVEALYETVRGRIHRQI
jgi:benzoyl-CoA reductase/2-hydroxyglutaryl-CoA dehydratase subunit BcrC/BadD/HgdB